MKGEADNWIAQETRTAQKKGQAKRLLHAIEATGQYVFHGSSTSGIVELEPRQAHDCSTGEQMKHGDPSIAGTIHADIAIFRAVINRGTTGFGKVDNTLEFCATQNALDLAKHQIGYVYVLKKEGFVPFGGNESSMEWRSLQAQKPERVVPVTFGDLPDGIKIIEPLEGKLL